MSELLIVNQTRKEILSNNAVMADTFSKRAKGLLGQKEFLKSLIITPCRQIHSWFMQFTFDAVFINEERKVVYTLERMKPFTVSHLVPDAWAVIELPPGTIKRSGTGLNDVITIERRDAVD